MSITLLHNGSYLYIHGASSDLVEKIKGVLTYEDKSISYLQYKGLVSSRIDPLNVVYDVADNDTTYVGFLDRIIKLLKTYGYKYTVQSTVKPIEPTKVELPEWLYKHQVEAIAVALENNRCLIKSPTGSGKSTIAGIYVSHFPNARIVVTVPQKALMYALAKEIGGLIGEEIGLVGDGHNTWRRVTVGIINSVINYKEELQSIDIRLIDECHYAAADMYTKLCGLTPNACRSVGFTATNWRSDGKDLLLEGAIGETKYSVTEQQLGKLGIVLEPTILQIEYKHRTNVPYKGALTTKIGDKVAIHYNTKDGRPDLKDVYDYSVVNNDDRNEVILDALELFLHDKRRTGSAVILVKYIEHGERLSRLAANRGLDIPFVTGKTNGKARLEYINKLNEGTIDCIIATSILNEGVNIPTLECVVLADPSANAKTTIQRIGRVMRTADGKSRALVIDIYDIEEWYLSRYSYKRTKTIGERYGVKPRYFKNIDEIKRYFNGK